PSYPSFLFFFRSPPPPPSTPFPYTTLFRSPLLLVDPETPAVGLVHAGWRGTCQGIAARAVEAMARAFGTRPRSCEAVLGPSIGPDRKSTRLNSSHVKISYAVFCLKKKKTKQ